MNRPSESGDPANITGNDVTVSQCVSKQRAAAGEGWHRTVHHTILPLSTSLPRPRCSAAHGHSAEKLSTLAHAGSLGGALTLLEPWQGLVNATLCRQPATYRVQPCAHQPDLHVT